MKTTGKTTRRIFVVGAGALALGAASFAHQAWLWRAKESEATPPLAPIPVFDLRESNPGAHGAANGDQVAALARACLGDLTPALQAGLHGADAMARRWLAASGTPYFSELARISAATGVAGLYLLNASYEWGCTALAAPAPGGASARLLRTLDWPFDGLGRRVQLLRQRGPAGDFAHLSWPGAVGVLTGLAPGRFAASINQPPIRRRAPFDSATLDAGFAAYDAWRMKGRLPALHLLRHVFETAPSYAAARRALETTPIAAPAIFTLVGVRPEHTCVIERDVITHVTREGVASAANAWRYSSFPGDWRAGPASELALDSAERSQMIEAWAGKAGAPFEWVAAPVLNGYTRLAVEADPGEGVLRARGYEEAENEEDSALAATLTLEWRA